jgi:diaminohydroxyphosphoribosylaminopyrimidine deaminase/5-amino-6-(5-phosphoribosylamino)uracil reductase
VSADLFMDHARELAERGRFTTAPNPLVGAVVARDGEIVGEGWHTRAGEDHAEVVALKESGPAARGAVLYSTLEPCNHHGRTPPCTEAILRAGVGKVVVGHSDPNPKMRGRSVELLREAGVEVEVLDDPFFERQNEQFVRLMRTGRPFVHVKLAVTLDGRIAAAGGDSRWVTGEEARRRAHLLRAEAGAVLVGAGTVRADDPLLTARGIDVDPPAVTRVVLDPHLTIGAGSRLARSVREAPVVVFALEESLDGRERALEDLGVEVAPVRSDGAGLDTGYVLDELGRRGLRGVLVEGGGETAGRFLSGGLVDRLTLFYAPKLIGADGVPMVGSLGLEKMAEALRFSVSEVERFGEDISLTLRPVYREEDVHRID